MADYNFSDAVILVTRAGMGSGEPELQQTLLTKYLSLLVANDRLPAAICFYTEGVRLVVEGSPLLDLLASLESRGVRLIVCTTCLDYYGLSGKVRVGIPGGMGDILEAQLRAGRVISL